MSRRSGAPPPAGPPRAAPPGAAAVPGGSLRAELLAIGSELLGPWRIDTNGSWLARRLGERGVPVRFRTVVGDDPGDLREAFRTALARAEIVVATGGLGPTVDDVTREAVSALLDLPLREDPAIARRIEERFRRHGLPMPPQNRRQAMVLEGAEVLPNLLGTAPGQILRPDGRLLVLLPGVPAEMRCMVDEGLLPRLPATGRRFAYRVLKVAGPTESDVDRRLHEVARRAAPVEWTILAAPGQVEVHLRETVAEGAPGEGIRRLERDIEAILGEDLFGRDDDTLEEVAARLLVARGQSVAVAESFTGGLVAARLVNVPGASAWLRGGAVCYSDDAKQDLGGVPAATLAAHGPVSRETTAAMAEGIRIRLGASWGVATSGSAGPDAEPGGRPPGTAFLATSGPGGTRVLERLLPGDRDLVRARGAQAALDLLRRTLLGSGT